MSLRCIDLRCFWPFDVWICRTSVYRTL